MNEISIDDRLKYKLELVGEWLYGNTAPKPVRIFRLNFDFYFELDKGYHDSNDKPVLNEQGYQYVITWTDQDTFSFHSDPSEGGLSLDEAIQRAEKIVEQKINWKK